MLLMKEPVRKAAAVGRIWFAEATLGSESLAMILLQGSFLNSYPHRLREPRPHHLASACSFETDQHVWSRHLTQTSAGFHHLSLYTAGSEREVQDLDESMADT
jgi:hypothetical protein